MGVGGGCVVGWGGGGWVQHGDDGTVAAGSWGGLLRVHHTPPGGLLHLVERLWEGLHVQGLHV